MLEINGTIWRWQGEAPAAWHFVTIPQADSLMLKTMLVKTGWGMIRVSAKIGKTQWRTSLFPQNQHYLLPIKASVRKAEKLQVDDEVTVLLEF